MAILRLSYVNDLEADFSSELDHKVLQQGQTRVVCQFRPKGKLSFKSSASHVDMSESSHGAFHCFAIISPIQKPPDFFTDVHRERRKSTAHQATKHLSKVLPTLRNSPQHHSKRATSMKRPDSLSRSPKFPIPHPSPLRAQTFALANFRSSMHFPHLLPRAPACLLDGGHGGARRRSRRSRLPPRHEAQLEGVTCDRGIARRVPRTEGGDVAFGASLGAAFAWG